MLLDGIRYGRKLSRVGLTQDIHDPGVPSGSQAGFL